MAGIRYYIGVKNADGEPLSGLSPSFYKLATGADGDKLSSAPSVTEMTNCPGVYWFDLTPGTAPWDANDGSGVLLGDLVGWIDFGATAPAETRYVMVTITHAGIALGAKMWKSQHDMESDEVTVYSPVDGTTAVMKLAFSTASGVDTRQPEAPS